MSHITLSEWLKLVPSHLIRFFFLRPSQVVARRVLIVPDGKKTRNVLKGWVKIKTSERSATQIEDNNKNKPETPLVPLAKPAKPRNPRNRGVLNYKACRDDTHDTEAVPAPADKV